MIKKDTFPKLITATVIIRKHKTNPNGGPFYKIPHSLEVSRLWKIRKDWETVTDWRQNAMWGSGYDPGTGKRYL